MTTLQNFPIVSQLTSITSDKRPSENAGYDCVPGSIGACILWYEHKSQWDSTINPDMLKDLAYGEAYRNDGTAAITYVPICQKLGYKLYAIDGNNAELVQKAHELIQANIPVIFTEPDPYSSNPGDSHVCVFYGEGNGALTALDPYIAKAITRTDGVWQSMLLFGQIWAIERIEEVKVLTIQEVSYFFEEKDATHWLCKQNGHTLRDGMLTFYKSYSGTALCGLTWIGLPKTDEIKIEEWRPPLFVKYAGHGITIQFCECGVLMYDPGHLIDQRPGLEGSVYLLQLYNGGPGQDPGITKLQAAVVDLQNKLAQSQATNPQLLTDILQIKGICGKY